MQPDKRLEQYGLSGTALSDNQVGLAVFEDEIDVVQYGTVFTTRPSKDFTICSARIMLCQK